MNIPAEVKIYMEDYRKALEKELSYVEANNWSADVNVFSRAKKEKRQRLITTRNLAKLKYFVQASEDVKEFKTVQSFISLLVKFIDIYIDRFDRCSDLYDWTIYEEKYSHLPEKELGEKIDNEIEFQSEVLSIVNNLRLSVQQMDLDDTNKIIDLPIYADIPAPFMLRNKFEKLYPKLKQYMYEKK